MKPTLFLFQILSLLASAIPSLLRDKGKKVDAPLKVEAEGKIYDTLVFVVGIESSCDLQCYEKGKEISMETMKIGGERETVVELMARREKG
ncbi:Uncharacterized protein TCM_012680 [Theobroma cacao]|uniref:Uncharacterized protein n=1 Tax=Theobroma cacao TaxID=3641 RepID=A0A061FWL8_THECC|nr:Uncharacterized protein TCM_012680 [Theobroma cacao]